MQYAAAAAKSLQSCPTLCDPIDGLLPGCPIPGSLQARNWSGLPFPSPMHEKEKWKWSRSVVSNSSRPHGLQPTRLLRPWDFPGKSTGVGCHCLLLNGILLSHKKKCIWICSNEVDETRAHYTEWRKSEREIEILYIDTHMWNLKRWHW